MAPKFYCGLALLLLVDSRFASGFINGGRPTKIAHFLQARKASKYSAGTITTITSTVTTISATVTTIEEKNDKITDSKIEDKNDKITDSTIEEKNDKISDNTIEDKNGKITDSTIEDKNDKIRNSTIEDKNDKSTDDSDNDFDTILRTRRTVNSFDSILPNDWEETLENAIQSAIYAPNHKRSEPWRFHLLGPETIRKVCELNASIVTKKKGAKKGQAKLERWLEMPGWLVVTCKTKGGNGNMGDPAGIDREDYAAVCCAVQNLCLSLHNAGMGTKWTTGPVNFDTEFSEIVGLKKEEYVVGTIWFGTPEANPSAPKKKKKIKDVFRRTN